MIAVVALVALGGALGCAVGTVLGTLASVWVLERRPRQRQVVTVVRGLDAAKLHEALRGAEAIQ